MQICGDSPWFALTLVGLLAACGSPDESVEFGSPPSNGGEDTSWRVDPPPGPDASSPDASGGHDAGGPDDAGPADDASSEEPQSTTFRIVNRTESTMRVQSHDDCDGRGPGWVSFPDFRPARMTNDCTVCTCDTLDSGPPCATCAKACSRPRVKMLEPGEELEWTWSGHLFRRDRDQGRACYRQQIPSRETYRAEFCWSKQAGPTGQNETLVDLECETTAFEYSNDDVVTQTITSSPDPEPAPRETTFELVNNGNQAIHLNPRSGCRPNDAEWLSVGSSADSEPYRLASDCTTCTCDEAQNGSCAVCKRRCPPRQPTPPELTIQPGETHTWTWSGHIYRNDQVNEQMCHRETVPPTDELEASLCWFEGQKSNPKQNCTSLDFTYGDDSTVRHEVEPQARPQETTVRLVNKLDKPIRIERGQAPCNPGPDWFSIRDQQRELNLATSCRTCSCQTAKNGTCGACAVRCAPGIPLERIPSGQSVEWTWPGWIYERSSVNNQSCMARRVPPSKTYEVRMCWSEQEGPVGSGHNLSSTTCETVQLDYGQDKVVVHEVTSDDASPQPSPTTFTLENRSNKPVHIKKQSGCQGEPGWLTLARQSELQVSDQCRCRCKTLKQGGACGVCACAPPRIVTIQPGDKRSWRWSGYTYRSKRLKGRQCWSKRVPSPGRMQAEFCWKKGKRSSGRRHGLRNPTCRQLDFTYGQKTQVSAVVQ